VRIETEENSKVGILNKLAKAYVLGVSIATGACLFFSRKDNRSLSAKLVESGMIGAVWPLTLVAVLCEGTASESIGSV
jgi:hypothetical protein